MKRHRTDANQNKIIDALKELGVSVGVITQGTPGIPDLVIGWRGQTHFAEIKNGVIGWKYTKDQEKFHAVWNGSPILTWQGIDDALLWIHDQS